ncbi:hypothetical protein BRD19_06000 [Halobacteriales archaeon SW_7_65_23]|nr:MAG: hypothetical protein BRD19_06000 [Halobacteriales archaeon SW_7_65_23]
MTGFEPNRREFLGAVLGAAGVLPTGSVAAGRGKPDAASETRERYAVDVFPGPSGQVWAQLTVTPGADTDELVYELPADASVLARRGFDSVADGLRWDGSDRPQVTYTRSPTFGWAAADDWGFVRKNEVVLDAPGVEPTRSVTFPRGGHGHPDLPGQSYVGPAASTTRTVDGVAGTYVRPDRWHAPAAPPPSLYFGVLDATARLLSLDDPFPSIGYAAPALSGSHGVAKRGTTAETARPHFAFDQQSPTSIAHEFVHTQQNYLVAREYRWLLEGVARFHEHVIGYRYGLLSLRPIDGTSAPDPLQGGRRTDVVYEKGAALCFLLDRKLRDLRDGGATLSDVLETLNEHDHNGDQTPTIDHGTFKDLVAEAASARLDGWLDERITREFELTLPADLEDSYPGLTAPRPVFESLPREITASGRDDGLRVGFAVATRDDAVESLELTITADSPDAVQLGEVTVLASDSAYQMADVHRSRRSRTLSITVEYPANSAPPSLDETPPIRVSLDPVGTAATQLRLDGSVTYRDGTAETLATGYGGTRAIVETEPPDEPAVVPRTAAVGKPVELAVVDPDPDAVYLWDFKGDGNVHAIGPRVTHQFGLLGEHTVAVTAVDRAGNRTAGSTTVSVTESGTPTVLDYADEDCLVRARGVRRRTGDSAAGNPEDWLLRYVTGECSAGEPES